MTATLTTRPDLVVWIDDDRLHAKAPMRGGPSGESPRLTLLAALLEGHGMIEPAEIATAEGGDVETLSARRTDLPTGFAGLGVVPTLLGFEALSGADAACCQISIRGDVAVLGMKDGHEKEVRLRPPAIG